jgi:hypothetical protein
VMAEAVRVLNHATFGSAGLEYPGDVYRVLGNLYIGTDGLVQLCQQLDRFLRRGLENGRLGVDCGGDPAISIAKADEAFTAAARAATTLTRALQDAQNAISAVHAKE